MNNNEPNEQTATADVEAEVEVEAEKSVHAEEKEDDNLLDEEPIATEEDTTE